MMKIFKLAFVVSAAAMFVACSDDDANSTHGLRIYYPNPSSILYGDQTADSIKVYSTDNYTLAPNNSWITLTNSADASQIVPSGYAFSYKAVPLTFAPNTTNDTVRTGSVTVTSSYNYKDGASTTAYYFQYNFLNVQRPKASYNVNTKIFSCAQSDSSYVTTDSLSFTMYSNWAIDKKPGETATWCNIPSTETTTGAAGTHIVHYTLDTNTTGADRSMWFRLTSATGVSTDIKITQFKAKD